MNAKIRRVRIEYLFGYKSIDMDLDDVTVLVGNNGTGKSTILRIIHSLLTLNESESLKLCECAELWIDDDIKIIYENFYKDDSKKIVEKILVETINSKDVNLDNMGSGDILKLLTRRLDSYNKNKKENKFRVYKDHVRTTQAQYVKYFLGEVGVEYISTVDLSANSRINFTSMEGEGVNMLDTYIELEASKLYSGRNAAKRTALRRVMNNHLADSGKRLRRTSAEITVECMNSGVLSYRALSSGERQLLYIMLKVVNGRDKNSIILMDEPEISLHLNWQETLIDSVREINPLSQLIIVTHSPGIVMNGYRDAFRDMKDIEMGKTS